jgi:positive regulator of sigma E activity
MQTNPAAAAFPSADMPQGTVLAVAGDRLTLAIESNCAHCGHGNACGIGKLAAGRRRQIDIERVDDVSFAGLQAGDRVCLAAPENTLSAAALLGYFFPALALLAGAGAGQIAGGDLCAVFGAGAGFAAALLLTRVCARRIPSLARIERVIPFPTHTTHTEHHHEH